MILSMELQNFERPGYTSFRVRAWGYLLIVTITKEIAGEVKQLKILVDKNIFKNGLNVAYLGQTELVCSSALSIGCQGHVSFVINMKSAP